MLIPLQIKLQQLPIKRTTSEKLKALRSNAFSFSLGLGLSAKFKVEG